MLTNRLFVSGYFFEVYVKVKMLGLYLPLPLLNTGVRFSLVHFSLSFQRKLLTTLRLLLRALHGSLCGLQPTWDSHCFMVNTCPSLNKLVILQRAVASCYKLSKELYTCIYIYKKEAPFLEFCWWLVCSGKITILS